MVNEKRPLKLYEKVMVGFCFLLLLSGFAMFILEICGIINFGVPMLWLGISLSSITQNCLRWENHTRTNVVFICLWGVLFVLNAIFLVLRLFL